MNLLEQTKYIFFELKNPFSFKVKYFLEKLLKMPFILLKYTLGFTKVPIPYLFKKDYKLYNEDWCFLIKAKSDFDYIFNPYFEKELRGYFKCQGTFLDIWAHGGKWSIFVAKQWNKVFSFEPNKETFSYLEKNIALNWALAITGINKWAWEIWWNLAFHKYENETWKSKFSQDWDSTVEVVAIDDFLKENEINIHEIRLIKIDTEGFELFVIRWMRNLLESTKNLTLICEILDNQKDREEIFEYFSSRRFLCKKLPTPADYIFYKE